jgi:hypothetical protein
MKTILFIISLFTFLNIKSQNKNIITSTISVRGNCEECKNRIENAVDIKGVKLAVWEEKNQVLTVTYNPEKVSLLQIKNAVVSKGHDADTLKAKEIIYNKLPTCCKYRNNKCELPKK